MATRQSLLLQRHPEHRRRPEQRRGCEHPGSIADDGGRRRSGSGPRQEVLTEAGSTVPLASLNVNVTAPAAPPWAPLTLHVTGVPELADDALRAGHLGVGGPCVASAC